MADLINQPTAGPTRKMWGVMISGALTSIANILLAIYVPALVTPEVMTLIQATAATLTFAIMSLAGYKVRERA